MLDIITRILSLQAFRVRNDDPHVHFSRKVQGREFLTVILGHQHVKYTLARLRQKQVVFGQPFTAFCENFQTSELDTPWVAEMLSEIRGVRSVLIGLNSPFSNIKIYPRDQRPKDIEKLFHSQLEQEVGRTFEHQTKYSLAQAGGQLCLNGIEREKTLKARERFRKWGFTVVGVFHYPTAILARASLLPLDWDNPGILVCYTQKLIFFMGWNSGEILTLRSRLIAEAQRGAAGTRPMLNTLQKEIETTINLVEGKAGCAVANLYTYHDRQDQTFAGLEAIHKAIPIAWHTDGIISDVQPFPEPDLGVIRELLPL